MKYTTSNTGYGAEIHLSGNSIKKATLGRSDMQDVKKVTSLMVDLIKRQRRLWRMELSDWQAARYAMYQAEYPRTYPMQEVYLDILLDGHLTGITENRTLRCTNNDYAIAINGVRDDKLTEMIADKPWFEAVLKHAHESIYFGYSAIWIKEFAKGEIKEVELIPRGLIAPEPKVLLDNYDSHTGIEIDSIKNIMLFASLGTPLGLLEKAAPYTILKRHSWGSWDEFEELFGVPIRIAKVASQSRQVKDEVAGWLDEMGSAAYGVFPIGTEIDIKENQKTDSFQVFMQKIKTLDRELSKLVLHQTMTTEDGASLSQSEVHQNTLEELIFSDKKQMLSFLNYKLLPAMRELGYPIPQNAKIIIDQTADPTKQITIDAQLFAGGYILTQEYIERTYGVDVETMPTPGYMPVPPGKD